MCLKDDLSESRKQTESQQNTVRGWLKSPEMEWTKSAYQINDSAKAWGSMVKTQEKDKYKTF